MEHILYLILEVGVEPIIDAQEWNDLTNRAIWMVIKTSCAWHCALCKLIKHPKLKLIILFII